MTWPSYPWFFDVADCLAKQISTQEAAGTFDEPEHNIPDDLVDEPPSHSHFWINPSPLPLPTFPSTSSRHSATLTAMDYKKKSSKICRAHKQADTPAANGTPSLKAIHLKCQSEAMAHVAQMTILFKSQQSLFWNFVRSVFAACTFNFGRHAITVPHLDFGNLSWGWCAITALGRFNPDLGGHLVLWDLKLIV
ncbi:hypothetical protein B0H14DRAFT_3897734 [Mycena olivaceomarginata]|nr:hypothetical protein B0H14DRAFT_3897734 [Mycena olivaceomarginata]